MRARSLVCGVLRFGVTGQGFRGWGSGFWFLLYDLGFGCLNPGFKAMRLGLGVRVMAWDYEFEDCCSGYMVLDLGFMVRGMGVEVSGKG